MLNVLKYIEEQPATITYDLYIPITIEFGSWDRAKEPAIYWRTGDFKRSLLEIGMGKATGIIRSITLTLSEKVFKTRKPYFNRKNLMADRGTPVFQVEGFKDQPYLDEKTDLYVNIGNKNIWIAFSENQISSFIEDDHIGFALDAKNNLCGILISGVLEHDRKKLEKALG
ncbi:hypothetical protein [Fictibacillus fluitans]|uniref:Uncharacterized protein n=1 Tax=Fictibacillus fluitans TaxID=3058422 RepID=A0ABT8HT80_9BACL|nr:hypothetical protein [Fictibacillus sp. NE201]MDN4523979.1 hypothetical protein [Fictibacillus sp. NE201]